VRVGLAALCALGLWAIAASALALPPVHGAVDGRLLFGVSNRQGGSLGLDLWLGQRTFRLGGTVGVGAVSKDGRVTSRVFTPLGLSLGIMPRRDKSGPTALFRGGVYAGAQKSGLIWGPFASCALGYGFALGEGASLRFGLDTWAFFRHNGPGSQSYSRGLFLGPYFGLGF
jgi:hypothetical protein